MRPGRCSPDRIMKAGANRPQSTLWTRTVWHGSTEMSRSHRQARLCGTHRGRQDQRGEAEGHRRLHTRTRRRDSRMREHDRCKGTQGPCSSAAAPPPEWRPEHRIDRPTPIRPRMGRLLEHGVVCRWPNSVVSQHASPLPGRSVPTDRAFTVACTMLQHTRTTVTVMTNETVTVTRCPPGKPRAPDAKKPRGKAQFRCRCGHHGTMPYPRLFKRLRRRKPLRLRCELCGEVLR
jgi:hypothetical protein